jgi:hypothetical protein
MPEVPIGFSKHLDEALEAVRKATEIRNRATDDEATLKGDHGELIIDERLLARVADVLRLLGETGAYANSRRDLPRIQAETDEYRGVLAQFAVRLGVQDELAVEAAQPTDAAQALVRSLISEGRNLTDARAQNATALGAERTSLVGLAEQRANRGDIVNPQPLREKFVALTPGLRNLEKRADLQHAIRVETRSLREAAGRLDPPVNNLDALAQAAIPSLETINRFRNDLNALATEIQREDDRLAAASEAMAVIHSKLAELTSGRPVPSAEIIATKRRERDLEWRALRATLFGSLKSLAEGQVADAVASFERHSLEADQLADDAVSDAKRIAAYGVETRRLEEERRKHTEAKARIAVLESRREEMLKAWTTTWGPSGILPLHPPEMAGWRSAVEPLLDRREKLEEQRDALAAVEAALQNMGPPLRALATEVGLSNTGGMDVAHVAALIEDRLKALVESWDIGRDLELRMRDAQRRIEKLTATEAELHRRFEELSARWGAALPTIGMASTATIEEAQAALDVWNEVPGVVRERNNRARRVAGMQRNIEAFERETEDLVRDIALDLAALPVDAAVRMLNERLTAARAAESRKTEMSRRLLELTRAREEADSALAQAEATLSAVAAKLPLNFDLTNLLVRLTERDNIYHSLEEHRTHLIMQAEGYEEAKLRAELVDFNPDGVESKLQVLADQEQALEREAQEVFAAHNHALRERAASEQGVGAEVAVQERASAEAELIRASRQWGVLKLGALLLGTAIDRRRANQHDPLIARAGVLFATLTAGSFAGIAQAYDDSVMPRLVGRRSTGETLAVSEMSTGARDQLYLALRLAYLEEYATRAEPAPFIGDDLFATFDEDRTENGLAALAAIGDEVQTIVFTHHRHLAEIAKAKLGADVCFL